MGAISPAAQLLLLGRSRYATPLPLDNIAAAAAYSLRKLRTAYNGAAIRVRRSSDNAEADIGFATEAITRTNLAPNPNMTGGIVGGLPTNMLHAGAIPGTTLTAVGPATVNGVNYYDTRVSGTPTATGGNRWLLAGITQGIPVATGQPFTISMDISIAAGSLTNATVAIQALGRNDSNTPSIHGLQSTALAITTTPQRFSLSGVGFPSPTTKIGPEVVVNVTSGAAMDLTLRVGRVCVEVGAAFHVVHIPVANTPTLVVSPGDLNVAELMGHVGSGSGFVTTWYDQSGNGRNATQATAASQPRIVNAGAVDTFYGKTSVRVLAGNLLAAPNPIVDTSDFSCFLVGTSTLGRGSDGMGAGWSVVVQGGASGVILTSGGVAQYMAPVPASGNVDLSTLIVDQLASTTNITQRTGGVSGSTSTVPKTTLRSSTFGIGLGANNSNSVVGYLSEVVFTASVLTEPQIQTLERNQGAYFGITVS